MKNNIKNVIFVYPWEEIKKRKLFDLHTTLDIKKFITTITNKGIDCDVASFPFYLCNVISFIIKDENEVDELYKKLQPYGIIKVQKSIYPELDDLDYTMLKYTNTEITEEILKSRREE